MTAPVFTGQRNISRLSPCRRWIELDNGLPARVCVTADPMPVVHLGDTVELEGTMEVAADLSQETGRDLDSRLRRQPVSPRRCGLSIRHQACNARRRSADGPASVLRRSAPGDAGVLLSGLVTGDDDGFSPARKNAFIRTGTTHLTAVSGSNLALVAGILATVGSATIGRHRAPWQMVTITGSLGVRAHLGSPIAITQSRDRRHRGGRSVSRRQTTRFRAP